MVFSGGVKETNKQTPVFFQSWQQQNKLYTVHNVAARLTTKTKKKGGKNREDITTVPMALHWLPVSFRIDFKILLITFKALHGVAPDYISELQSHYQAVCNLRCSEKNLWDVPTSRFKTKGDWTFAVMALWLWNDLPEELTPTQSGLIIHFWTFIYITRPDMRPRDFFLFFPPTAYSHCYKQLLQSRI